jgi:hypothetical protein
MTKAVDVETPGGAEVVRGQDRDSKLHECLRGAAYESTTINVAP